ncbi:MAG: ATP-binding protein, partial [Pseudomonadota bacterium]
TNISLAQSVVNFSLNFEFVPFVHSYVWASRILLSQVIANLLINAAESIGATGRDDGQIQIQQALIETEEGAVHQLTIADNGDGFGEEVKSKLFTRGFSTRTAKSGGNGLHWCHNTVNMMRGTLTLISEGKGKGARAVLIMPIYNISKNENATSSRKAINYISRII